MEQMIEQNGQRSSRRVLSLAIVCTILMVAISPYTILFGMRVPIYGWTQILTFFKALVVLPFLAVLGIVCSFQLLRRNVWRGFAVVLGIISAGVCAFVLWQWIRLDLLFSGRIGAPQPWKAALGGAAIAFVTFLVAIRFTGGYKRTIIVRTILLVSCLCVAVSSFHALQFLPRFLERGDNLLSLKRYRAEAMVGTRAPDFTLQTIRGATFNLESNKGKVLLLDFWATWCGPCIAEMPHLERTHQELRDTSATVVAVSMDVDTSKVKPFIDSLHYSFTALYGNHEISELYRLDAIPTTLLIDKKGIIREVQVGYIEKAFPRLKNVVQKYLGE
jgi:peroxiredoxin